MTHPVFFSSQQETVMTTMSQKTLVQLFTFVTGSFTFALPIVGILSLLAGHWKRWRRRQQQHPRCGFTKGFVPNDFLSSSLIISSQNISISPAGGEVGLSVSGPVQSSETHLNSPCAQTFIKSNLCIYRTQSEEKTSTHNKEEEEAAALLAQSRLS